jgi:hypothetical protein
MPTFPLVREIYVNVIVTFFSELLAGIRETDAQADAARLLAALNGEPPRPIQRVDANSDAILPAPDNISLQHKPARSNARKASDDSDGMDLVAHDNKLRDKSRRSLSRHRISEGSLFTPSLGDAVYDMQLFDDICKGNVRGKLAELQYGLVLVQEMLLDEARPPELAVRRVHRNVALQLLIQPSRYVVLQTAFASELKFTTRRALNRPVFLRVIGAIDATVPGTAAGLVPVVSLVNDSVQWCVGFPTTAGSSKLPCVVTFTALFA